MAEQSSSLVEFKQVTFAYPGAKGDRVILKDLSLSVPRGKVTALMGASGGGKTTVLRLIGGQQKATSGDVLFDAQNVSALRQTELYAARRRMGMLFQFGALFTDLSVFDNVAFPLREHTLLGPELIRDIVLMKLDAVGLRGARDLMPSEISGGMKKRVGIARAIVMNPKYLFCDEPNSGLDPLTSVKIDELIKEITDEFNITTIVITHDMNSVIGMGQKIMFLYQGKKLWEGDNSNIRTSDVPELHEFIFANKLLQEVKM